MGAETQEGRFFASLEAIFLIINNLSDFQLAKTPVFWRHLVARCFLGGRTAEKIP